MISAIIIITSAVLTSALVTLVRFLFSKLSFSSPGGNIKNGGETKKKQMFSIFPDSKSDKDPYGEE